VINLGTSSDGAGDPAGLVYDRSGAVVVALAGVDQVALGRSSTGHFRRVAAGQGPSALAMSPDGKVVYVAGSQSDTVSVVEVATGRLLRAIGLGPRPEPTLVERGERLFRDARLSHDGWMSCHTCHTDGHTNGQLVDTMGDDSYGAPKRVPSLLGTGTTGPWSWTGSVDRLEDQVRKSIEKTMRGDEPSKEQVAALTAYLRSLTPPPVAAPVHDGTAATRGREVFRKQRCTACHSSPHYTTGGTYDVGLVDEAGNELFNPPSLRGVGGREPLFHDGRATTLEEVFQKHRHPRNTKLSGDEIADLIAFLKTL
jgi:YVTN family beta-propeller protein